MMTPEHLGSARRTRREKRRWRLIAKSGAQAQTFEWYDGHGPEPVWQATGCYFDSVRLRDSNNKIIRSVSIRPTIPTRRMHRQAKAVNALLRILGEVPRA